MKSDEREKNFRIDLEILLEKHGADLDIDDIGKLPYVDIPVISVSMAAIYDDDGVVHEYCEFVL